LGTVLSLSFFPSNWKIWRGENRPQLYLKSRNSYYLERI